MLINGSTMKDVWKSIDEDVKDYVYEAVGKTYITGVRDFLPKEVYELLNETQKKYVNIMCNRAFKAASSPWIIVREGGNPRNEGQYWCVIFYRVPSDGFKTHAVVDTRFYGDLDGKVKWNSQTGGWVGEEIYAWMDSPIHNTKLPPLPDGVTIE